MNTEREKILDEVMSALTGITGVIKLHRSRFVALAARKESPAILVEPVNDTADRAVVGQTNWSFTFQVSVIVRGLQSADSAADEIVGEIHKRIMQSAVLQTYIDVKPISSNWTFPESAPDMPLAIVLNLFQIDYRTPENEILT